MFHDYFYPEFVVVVVNFSPPEGKLRRVKLKSVNLAKTLWTHQVPLYSSRILEKFDLNPVELIKVD